MHIVTERQRYDSMMPLIIVTIIIIIIIIIIEFVQREYVK